MQTFHALAIHNYTFTLPFKRFGKAVKIKLKYKIHLVPKSWKLHQVVVGLVTKNVSSNWTDVPNVFKVILFLYDLNFEPTEVEEKCMSVRMDYYIGNIIGLVLY